MILVVSNKNLLEKAKKTFLTSAVSAAGTTLTVKDNTGIANGDYLMIGELGEEGTEIKAVNGAVSAGTSITITAVTFAHGVDTPIYNIRYNQAEFSRATTLTGSKTVLTTASIDPSELFTSYEDTSNTTGYGFIRWKNSTTSAVSSYSGGVNYENDGDYSSYDRQTLFRMRQNVRQGLAETEDDGMLSSITDQDIDDALNSRQQDVYSARHWTFAEAERSQDAVEDQFAYNISTDLDVNRIQYTVFDTQPLAPISNLRWKNLHWDNDATGDPTHVRVFNGQIFLYPRVSADSSTTTLGAAVSSATATTITVADGSSFNRGDYFRFEIDSEVIYATAYDSDNTQFTGCLRGQEGTTAATHTNGTTVTELDIVVSGQLKPTDLFLASDRTPVPKPKVLETGAISDIGYGKLRDKALGDRFLRMYEKEFKDLESDYSIKDYGQFPRIKDKDELVRDHGVTLDPNAYIKSINT